MASNLVK